MGSPVAVAPEAPGHQQYGDWHPGKEEKASGEMEIARERGRCTRRVHREGTGHLDREAVGAVLDVMGARQRPGRATWPCGLTDREVQVLRLLARGRSNEQIAAALGISPRTAQHHVIHIYQKSERNSRAGAALFATEHQLLDPSCPDA